MTNLDTTTRATGTSASSTLARAAVATLLALAAPAVSFLPLPKPVPPVKSAPDRELTSRQLEIARLIAEGLTNRQIANRLFLSERTVETHITNILNRLGLNSRVQLSRWIAEVPSATPR